MNQRNVLPVSVVIPTFNGEKYIQEALRSVDAQSHLPREIIVVDDASTDRTIQRVQEFASGVPVPVRVIQLSKNSGGPARPMNVGIHAAQSSLITVLDQDDVFCPRKIERQASVLNAHPDVAFVYGYIDLKREPNMPNAHPMPTKQWRRLRNLMAFQGGIASCDGGIALRMLLCHGNCVGGFPAFMFRRDDWQALGGFDERLAGAVDYDFLCMLCQRGQVAVVPEVHYLYRFHDANLSRSRVLCHTDRIETLAKHALCRAWPAAHRELRQTTGKILYALAVALGAAGSNSIARRLLTTSLLMSGVRARSIVRAAYFPIKVFRGRRRWPTLHTERCAVDLCPDELDRAARSVDIVSKHFGRGWWRLFLRHEQPPKAGLRPAFDSAPTVIKDECAA